MHTFWQAKNYWLSFLGDISSLPTCSARTSDGRACVFSGELSTRVPRDGRTLKAGYCNMSTVQRRRAFNCFYDMQWVFFTDLVMWVRGDGRTYKVSSAQPVGSLLSSTVMICY